MEQKPASIWKSSLMSGIYLGIVLILYNVVLYVTDQSFNKTLGYVSIAIIVIGVIWAQISFKKQQGNILTYGQGVGVAVITMLFAGTISMIYTLLLYKVIDPGLHEQFLLFMEEQTTAALVERGMGEEQIQTSIAMQQKFQTPVIMAVGALINSVIMGLIAGLITSIFIKKNPVDEVPE